MTTPRPDTRWFRIGWLKRRRAIRIGSALGVFWVLVALSMAVSGLVVAGLSVEVRLLFAGIALLILAGVGVMAWRTIRRVGDPALTVGVDSQGVWLATSSGTVVFAWTRLSGVAVRRVWRRSGRTVYFGRQLELFINTPGHIEAGGLHFTGDRYILELPDMEVLGAIPIAARVGNELGDTIAAARPDRWLGQL